MDLPVEEGDKVRGRDCGKNDAGESEDGQRDDGARTRFVHGVGPPAAISVKGEALFTLPDGSTGTLAVKRRRRARIARAETP
jgi:hypothetical protein